MNDAKLTALDDTTLLAYREGSLDCEARRAVEERLGACPAGRERLHSFDRDLEFLKAATADASIAFPDRVAIQRRSSRIGVRIVAKRAGAAMAAAAMLFLAVQSMRPSEVGPVVPSPRAASMLGEAYLDAAIAQLEYESALVRDSRAWPRREPGMASEFDSHYEGTRGDRLAGIGSEESASILLRAAQYWSERDASIAESRYRDVANYFPDSVAADEAREVADADPELSSL